jgi:hypothetical protein
MGTIAVVRSPDRKMRIVMMRSIQGRVIAEMAIGIVPG